ncbi:spheroidene monooxygenase [Hymenobacter caeli]|uniref:Heme-degrading monooxygenase HmoA n=1 Tax=Hymenobacter caeli TaxID=2735894 RepID=A0ABX2FUY3_9BACT|nr:heme-degrading monooxygenase HmoA [Hymenobacter caeli]
MPRPALPLTTLSLVTLRPGHARWALAQMGTAVPLLRRVPGLRFHKLLGSGAGGFGALPNLRRYGLLAVWDEPAAAAAFFAAGGVWREYERRAAEIWTAQLRPLKAQGRWDGTNPFDYAEAAAPGAPADGPVAVLTRASIHWLKTPRFWRYVAPTSAALAGAPGVALAIGLGELPVVRQATFSVWRSAAAMQQYAYHDARHREAMLLTRRENWYSEELFARFQVLRSEGTVDGHDPLAQFEIG